MEVIIILVEQFFKPFQYTNSKITSKKYAKLQIQDFLNGRLGLCGKVKKESCGNNVRRKLGYGIH